MGRLSKTCNTFIRICELCCCRNMSFAESTIESRKIAIDVWNESDNLSRINLGYSLSNYLACEPYSNEGHAKLREMMEYLSKYMDKHDIEKDEAFTTLWIEFHEYVTPDGKNNYEERIKQKPINQIVEEDSVMIDIKNRKLEEIKNLVKEIHELDEKLDTKNIDPENDSRSTLVNIIEKEYDCEFVIVTD